MPTDVWLSLDEVSCRIACSYRVGCDLVCDGCQRTGDLLSKVFMDAKAFFEGERTDDKFQSERNESVHQEQHQRMNSRDSEDHARKQRQHSDQDTTNTDASIPKLEQNQQTGAWGAILLWLAMIFKRFMAFDRSSHESEGRFARGKHCHRVKTPNIGVIGPTITEPTIHIGGNPGEIGLGAPPLSEIVSRQMTFQGMACFGRDHLFPHVADLVRAGFRRVGRNLVCDGCQRSHPIARYSTMDLRPASLHYDWCRFSGRVLCRYCCHGLDSMGQDGAEICVRCCQTRSVRTFGHNVVPTPIPRLEEEHSIKAFVEEICCIEGCNRLVRQGRERCLRCSGIVCDHCAGRSHIH